MIGSLLVATPIRLLLGKNSRYMKTPPLSTEAFNLIAIGAWNPAIFSPEWVKAHLADDKNADVILAVSMPPTAMLSPRITVDGVNIYPSNQALAMDCVVYSDAAIEVCANKIAQISGILPHTPVSALGINFRFWGELTDSAALTELFTFADAANIDANQYKSAGALIRRTFELSDSTNLNLSIDTLSQNLRIEFNFHADIQHISQVAEIASIEKIRANQESAKQFLQNVYGVELEE